jgi:DeoR/GlpR family transcriptional regulator of sugar metabolism
MFRNDTDGRVKDFDPSEIAVKKAAMQRSAHSFLLASRQSSDVGNHRLCPG